ncbi:Protein of unknown function (DUF2580) [Streptoalloteichus tenebrarius]|uniref:WXG100 family type VII secretion target n=1 Tax=Streptoalloteichus tenebrarius (strain ATCC 17920 / DSM 40477 / JCM 4838 / CBS 697.72 / NBRC 16177 / NCIMB 11028 / NRRL B-12390 / A12253. 1 / ISP 5477) TaxID=1933 RepID=A0ABT1HQH9_STRSD|nr:hypothetical protein [Streptoalloteichus tenebrarius]MCP2257770.1 Protein of unknown function (DUF2580) [Streptoalloteichus tenebrarius]
MDFTLKPAALRAKARYERERADVIEALAEQVQQARATEDCFGLIGQHAGFFSGYDDMVNKVEENIRKAAEFLRTAADRLEDSTETYTSVDKGFAELFGKGAEGGDFDIRNHGVIGPGAQQ